VVVDDLDILSIPLSPPKTDPPLIVDADAVLPRTIARQLLQAIARRTPKVFQGFSRI
jgi:hypothetical protein